MTRLLTEGFESGSILGVTSSYRVSISTTTNYVGSGVYAIADTGNGAWFEFTIPDSGELYIRWRSWINQGDNATDVYWMNGSTTLGSCRVGTVNNPNTRYYVGDTLKQTNLNPVAILNTKRLYEVRVKLDNSNGIIEHRIDGILVSSYTGDTIPAAITTINKVRFYSYASSFDDIAINDTNGAADNSWCGDGKIIALLPNAAGDSNMLVPTSGSAINNYTMVDDRPHDSDTTYVESSTPDDKDLYNLAACGLSSGSTVINRVWVENIAKDTTTGSGIIKNVMKTNGSEYDSAEISLTTSYALNKGAEQLVNPQSSAAWTPEELDALQVGVKVVQ